MFPFAKEPTLLEREIDRVVQSLGNKEIASDEYAKMVDQLAKLHKMKEDEASNRVSKDTIAIVGANLLGIMLIIRHEHVNVITSRAMNLVMKPR